jgi:hypothetical protein
VRQGLWGQVFSEPDGPGVRFIFSPPSSARSERRTMNLSQVPHHQEERKVAR